MLLLIIGAYAVEPPDAIPLRLPPAKSFPRQKADATTIVRERDFRPAEPDPFTRTLTLGAFAQAAAISGDLRGGGGVAAQATYQPRFAQGAGVFLEPGVAGLWRKSGAADVSAFWFALPVGVSYLSTSFGPGGLKVVAAVTFDFFSSYASGTALSKLDRYWTLGALAGVGYAYQLGRGTLAAELRYRLVAYSVADTRNMGHGAMLLVGYQVHLL